MHDVIEIRSFQQEDEVPLIKLWEKCELVVAWNDPSKDISRKVQLDTEGLLLGWYDNSLITSVMAGYEGHRGWINYLAVDPKFRRKGLGKTMMKAAMASMRKDRRVRAAELFSERSVVNKAEFRKMRPDATKINPAAPSCNSGQGEASSQKALMNL